MINEALVQTETLVRILQQLAEESEGDVSKIVKQLGLSAEIPKDQLTAETQKYQRIASRNQQEIRELAHQLKVALGETSQASASGGVTKLEITGWGYRLYVSHEVLQDSSNPISLITTLIALLGPIGPILAAIISTYFIVAKIKDEGNGVIFSGLWIMPQYALVTPQKSAN